MSVQQSQVLLRGQMALVFDGIPLPLLVQEALQLSTLLQLCILLS